MKYIEIGKDLTDNKIFGRIDEDGLCRFTCTEDNPEYQAWLNPAEQSTPNLAEQCQDLPMIKLNARILKPQYIQEDGSVYALPKFKFSKMVYRDKSFAGYDLVARRLWLTLRNTKVKQSRLLGDK